MAQDETRRNKTKRGRAANGAGTLVLRGHTYHARWWANGHLISRSTGCETLEAARAWLAEHSVSRTGLADRAAVTKLARLVSASLDDADIQLRTVALPVRRLFEIYKSSAARRPVKERTLDDYRQSMECLADWIERRHPEIASARDISQSVADEYVEDRAKTVSGNRINKHLNLFAAVWRTLSRRYGLEYNPWSSDHIARRVHTPETRRALTDKEVRALLKGSEGEYHLMVLIGISTGLRLGDILNLRWPDHIDLKRREIAIRRTQKTGAAVVLPMIPELHRELLAAFRARTDEIWVLPHQHARLEKRNNPAEICKSLARLFRRCGIQNAEGQAKATFHSLRHTFVSRLMRRGVSPALVQAAVGHSTMMMTEHYTHISAADLRRGLAETRRRPAVL